MTNTINMNQVLFHTPNVEKIQATEQMHPDQMQRQASVEETANMRQRTETVQTMEESENSKNVDNKKREKGKKDKKQKRNGRSMKESTENSYHLEDGSEDADSGAIVDIRI